MLYCLAISRSFSAFSRIPFAITRGAESFSRSYLIAIATSTSLSSTVSKPYQRLRPGWNGLGILQLVDEVEDLGDRVVQLLGHFLVDLDAQQRMRQRHVSQERHVVGPGDRPQRFGAGVHAL